MTVYWTVRPLGITRSDESWPDSRKSARARGSTRHSTRHSILARGDIASDRECLATYNLLALHTVYRALGEML